MKKKLLALVLAAVMILGFMPKNVKADDPAPANSVTVYFSLSDDEGYIEDIYGDPIAFREIEVPYFDLGVYGLSYYYFSNDHYENGDPDNPWSHYSDLQPGTQTTAGTHVTLLHLLIYAMEKYCLGYPESECGTGYHDNESVDYIKTLSMPSNNLNGNGKLTISGTPGSLYFENYWGIYGDYDPYSTNPDDNWNYFVNYKYPLASPGWGATADQILLEEGDIITMGHFSEYGQLFDPNGIFAYARPLGESYNNTPADDLTVLIGEVEEGDPVDLTFYHTRVDSNFDRVTDEDLPDDVPVYVCNINDLSSGIIYESGSSGLPWDFIDYTTDGDITVDTNGWTAGTYLIATPGWNSANGSNIVCTPGGILIEVVN